MNYIKKLILSIIILFSIAPITHLKGQLKDVTLTYSKAPEPTREEVEERQREYKQKRQDEKNIENFKYYGKNALVLAIFAIIVVWFLRRSNEDEHRKNLEIAMKLIKEGANDDYIFKVSKLPLSEIEILRKQINKNA